MYLEFQVAADSDDECKDIIINNIVIRIGGQQIDKHYGAG